MVDVTVELLHTEGCPNAAEFLPRLRRLVSAAGVADAVVVRVITDAEQADREQFLGSPTVRVNGRDVDPDAHARTNFGLSCRLYAGPAGLRGTPPDAWVWALLCPDSPPALPARRSERSDPQA